MTTSPDEAKATVQRWFHEIWSQGDEQAVDEVLAPDLAFILSFNQVNGRDAFKRLLQANRTAFENLTYSANDDDIVVESDKAAAYWTMHTDKHRGTWQNIPPSGKEASIHGMSLFRFSNGQISEIRVISDFYSLLAQIGGIEQ
ncbi:MAG TPA: ester cyclase [Thermomicrobiaceae bacterium]|nr:ester cyclase [Thermomicrobiaceae bacterium]